MSWYRLTRQGEPTLVLGKALLFPQGHVVALKHAADRLAVFPQDADQHGQQQFLDALHTHGQDLYAQKVMELVHRQAGEGVGLAEDDAAAVQVIIPC